jgi:hypothetical protein
MSMKKPENPYKKSMFTSNNKNNKVIASTEQKEEITTTDNTKIEKFKNSLKKSKPDSKTYSFYLETNLVKKVEKLAKETNNSASTILNKILQEFFD